VFIEKRQNEQNPYQGHSFSAETPDKYCNTSSLLLSDPSQPTKHPTNPTIYISYKFFLYMWGNGGSPPLLLDVSDRSKRSAPRSGRFTSVERSCLWCLHCLSFRTLNFIQTNIVYVRKQSQERTARKHFAVPRQVLRVCNLLTSLCQV
jgi:hypothetical protein